MKSAAEFHPSEIPAKPGVYIYRDRFDRVIYVGKAVNLRRRMSSYFQLSRRNAADPKLRSLIHSIAGWSYEVVHSEAEALLLEARLIKTYAPHYNILMRDDKRYLLLKIDWAEKFPTLSLARVKKQG
ncbi:MAG: GIY-YIG nuclease family protein, partial [Victivallaceae bacterium]|nr:GIY-YIG nuclease family protein [Victivallaceae bacterium]